MQYSYVCTYTQRKIYQIHVIISNSVNNKSAKIAHNPIKSLKEIDTVWGRFVNEFKWCKNKIIFFP